MDGANWFPLTVAVVTAAIEIVNIISRWFQRLQASTGTPSYLQG